MTEKPSTTRPHGRPAPLPAGTPDRSRRLTREEIAKIEVGRTDVSRRVAWGLILAFLATVFSVPVAQHAYELRAALTGDREPTLPQCYDIFDTLPRAWESIFNGEGDSPRASVFSRIRRTNDEIVLRDIQEYTDTLEDSSLLTDALLPPAQRAMTRYLGVGNEEAYLGRDGWLFYRPGVDYVTGPGFLSARHREHRLDAVKEWQPPTHPDPVPAIADFARQLADRGVGLLLLPTPVKPQVHPEKLTPRFAGCREVLQNPSYDAFLARLAEAAPAVGVFDPADVLMEMKSRTDPPTDVYLATDTHWRPEAMDAVARRLADAARTALGEGVEGAAVACDEEAVEVTNLGDIAVMVQPLVKKDAIGRAHARLGGVLRRLGVSPAVWATHRRELFPPQTVTTRRVLGPDAGPWRADPNADILLLGDSFTNIFSSEAMGWGDSAGLAERLSRHLARPVDAIVRNSDSAYATRQMLAAELGRGRDRLAGKRLVIWQFAQRELSAGDWRPIELPELPVAPTVPAASQPAAGEGEVTDVLELAPGETAVVTGRIAALKRSPKPGSVPYKDHLMPVHLVGCRTADGRVRDAEIVLKMWGLRDNRSTPAVRLGEGQTITVRVRRWGDVESKLGTLNTAELDDPDLLLAPIFWAEEMK